MFCSILFYQFRVDSERARFPFSAHRESVITNSFVHDIFGERKLVGICIILFPCIWWLVAHISNPYTWYKSWVRQYVRIKDKRKKTCPLGPLHLTLSDIKSSESRPLRFHSLRFHSLISHKGAELGHIYC